MVFDFLKADPESAFARKEIARKAVHRSTYEENPHWVDAPLHALLHRKLIAINDNGHYQVKKEDLD